MDASIIKLCRAIGRCHAFNGFKNNPVGTWSAEEREAYNQGYNSYHNYQKTIKIAFKPNSKMEGI